MAVKKLGDFHYTFVVGELNVEPEIQILNWLYFSPFMIKQEMPLGYHIHRDIFEVLIFA